MDTQTIMLQVAGVRENRKETLAGLAHELRDFAHGLKGWLRSQQEANRQLEMFLRDYSKH